MPTIDSVDIWIGSNVLDKNVWVSSNEKEIAVIQATRNLTRWYPEVELTDELVAYQSIWELQGLDPALKFQKQGIKAISEGQDRIDYLERDKVSPEVREIIGPPLYEQESITLEGGILL